MTGRAVAVVAVDGLALINRTYGRDAGDHVLHEVGRRLAATSSDGSEYVLHAADAACLAERVTVAMEEIRAPIAVGDHRLYVTASAGLASGSPAGDLVAAATVALHAAKAGGGDRAEWFGATAHPVPGDRLRLANDLRRGIDRGEMRLLFEPVVALADREIAGMRVVVRWQRPSGGLLALEDFGVAGCNAALGAWTVEHACRTATRLTGLSAGQLTMSIDLSAQVSDPACVAVLHAALRDSGCAPSSLVVGMTGAPAATLDGVRALGVRVELSGVGADGRPDRVTIGAPLVRGLGVDSEATAIVESTVLLAHTLGAEVVADGVATEAQLTLLRAMGCDLAQGPVVGGPLTLGHLQRLLRERTPVRRRNPARPAAAPETGRILRLHADGASLHTIAGALNGEGRRTATGARWSPKSVARVVTDARSPVAGVA